MKVSRNGMTSPVSPMWCFQSVHNPIMFWTYSFLTVFCLQMHCNCALEYGTLECYTQSFASIGIEYLLCPVANPLNPTSEETSRCQDAAEEISQIGYACSSVASGTAGSLVSLSLSMESSLGGYVLEANSVTDCTDVTDGLNFIHETMISGSLTIAECQTGGLFFIGLDHAKCTEYLNSILYALDNQVSDGQCAIQTSVTTTATTTDTSSVTSSQTTSVTSTVTSSVTSSATTTFSTTQTSTRTTSQSTTMSTTQSSTRTTSVSTTETSSMTSTMSSTVSTTATSSQTTTPTTTPITTNQPTPRTPTIQCIFQPLTTEEGSEVFLQSLPSSQIKALEVSFLSQLLGTVNEYQESTLTLGIGTGQVALQESNVSEVRITRGKGDHAGLINARAHLQMTMLGKELVAEMSVTALNAVPVTIAVGEATSTSLECMVVDGRVSADLMFRAYAHRKFNCPGDYPQYDLWVL